MQANSDSLAHIANSQHSVWREITREAKESAKLQPEMASFFYSMVLTHKSFASAISFYLASRFADKTMSAIECQSLLSEAMAARPALVDEMIRDLLAHYTRDAACDQYILPLLYFKGFHAIQAYRIAHYFWQQGRKALAIYFQHRIAALFDVDIHPAAIIGSGIMLDHATGLVIGETSIIEDDVSILHSVTLGGSGSQGGQRHPKVCKGVLISAGSKLLGDINIGECAKIGAGSLVLADVAPHTTVAGVPAKLVGRAKETMPSISMDHQIDE